VITGRALGLDFGQKRIGVAVSDPFGMMAMPLAFVPNTPEAIGAIKALVSQYQIGVIVLGLPLNMKGEETPSSQKVRAFAEKLKKSTGLPVHFQDERFSTQAVERMLIGADMKRDKRKLVIDSQAAAFVLQGFLDRVKVSEH
jgi:putative Holliday junction resolvase